MAKTNHPEYNLYRSYWNQVRTFAKGMRDVQDYLQNVTNKTDPQSAIRNRDYKARAKYTNFTSRTRNALSGAVFRKEPNSELPSALEFLEDNANGAGLTLNQLAKSLVSNLIEIGRHGLFVDYGISAKIVSYSAENIIDWETDEAGLLSKVVLITGKKQEKHLVIDNDGFYAVEYYKDDEDKPYEIVTPTKSDGSRFDYIPFIFCGSVNNSPDVDDMPLWAIVDISQGHYQNSAEYEDLIRCMPPTIAVTVPNKSWQEEMLPSGYYEVGDGNMIPLPDGGTAILIQASANTMAYEAMKHKEDQLIMLGARLISGGGGVETAEAVRIKYSSENSVLDNLANNASEAIEKCLYWCAEFEGIQGDIKYELNREFWDTKLSPQDISAQILLLNNNVKAMSDVRNTLRESGELAQDRKDEDIDGEIEIFGSGL